MSTGDTTADRVRGFRALGRSLPGRVLEGLRRVQLVGGIAFLIVTLALSGFMGFRMAELASNAGRSAGWSAAIGIISAIFVAMVALLLVYWYSRGSSLGEFLDEGSREEEDTHRISNDLRADAIESIDKADVLATTGDGHLALADEIRSRLVGHATQGIYAAAVVLGVEDLQPPAPHKLVELTTPMRAETDDLAARVRQTSSELRGEAGAAMVVLPAVVPVPYAELAADRPGDVDESTVDPTLLPSRRVVVGTGSNRRALFIALAVLATVVVGLGVLIAIGALPGLA
jgi:hypothetical protein